MAKTDKNVPCYMCERRKPLCHSSCEAYKAYARARIDKADMIRKQKADEAMLTEVRLSAIQRSTKDRNIKKQNAWKG